MFVIDISLHLLLFLHIIFSSIGPATLGRDDSTYSRTLQVNLNCLPVGIFYAQYQVLQADIVDIVLTDNLGGMYWYSFSSSNSIQFNAIQFNSLFNHSKKQSIQSI